MSFPTIFDWINKYAAWRGLPAVYIVLLLTLVILVVHDWRISLLALLGQYLVSGLLFVEVLEPRLASVKVLVGLFVCLILYVTGRQVYGGRQIRRELKTAVSAPIRQLRVGPFALSADTLFQIFLTALVLLVVLVLGQQERYSLPGIPMTLSFLNLAIYGLTLLGMFVLSLSGEPLRASMGFFLVLIGFELFYSVQEQSVTTLVGLAALNLIVATAVAYLAQVRQRMLLHHTDAS